MRQIDLRRVVSFLAVGGTTALLYYALIGLFYSLLGMPHLIAISIAYLGGIGFHFVGNRTVTFGAHGGDAKAQGVRYLVLAGLNYVVAMAVVLISVDTAGWNVYVGSTLAIFATMAIGYLGMQHWVFAPAARK